LAVMTDPFALQVLSIKDDKIFSYTATHELFCNISLHGKRTISNHDRFVLQFRADFVCCLHLLGYDKIK